ncbi:MAG TPA: hypothetical protein DIV86_04175, partial [Alphaproteobacteria bacterium]|nr:hypothetical protein [Alphaproteobacteria bacterium]
MKYFIYISVLFLLIFIPEQGYSQTLSQDCKAYPGLVNKIVKCVTRMTSYSVLESSLNRLYTGLVGASNAAVVLYIMIFGFKMAAGGLQNLRREAFFVIATAVAVLTFNNTVSVTTFLNIFLRTQAEFASAATFAVSTKPPEQATVTPDNGTGSATPPANAQQNYTEIENAICYGPKDTKYKPTNPEDPPYKPEMSGRTAVTYNVWQRIDCIIGYVLGAHPVVEKISQYYETEGEKRETTIGTVDNRKFDYDLFAGPENPFADMATDPFCFLTDLKINVGTDKDACEKKRVNIKKTGTYEVGVSFSLFVIAVGMFTESAQSGGIGLIVLLTGVFIVILMISAFGQVMIVYISSMFAIVVLAMFAPLCIPCILFKPTKEIFQKWLQMFFGYTLTPGIMLSYLTFMIFVIQYMISYSKPVTTSMSQCIINGQICDPKTNSACPSACANFSIDAGFSSLSQMNFGGMYRNGSKGLTSILNSFQGNTTQISGDRGLAGATQETSGTSYREGIDLYRSETMLGMGYSQHLNETGRDQTSRSTVIDLSNEAANTQMNISGGSTSSVDVFTSKFPVYNCSEWIMGSNGVYTCPEANKIYINENNMMWKKVQEELNNGGLTNLDTDGFAQDFQNEELDEIIQTRAKYNEQQWSSKANYMQVLLIRLKTPPIIPAYNL